MRTRFTRDTAYASALRLIQTDPAPTALFASNNVLGEAAFSAIRDSGLRVPQDISVLMFDDVPWASLISPPVTVVSQPARQMGAEAARLALNPAQPGSAGVRVLPYEFIIRRSCRPWHAAAESVKAAPPGAGEQVKE